MSHFRVFIVRIISFNNVKLSMEEEFQKLLELCHLYSLEVNVSKLRRIYGDNKSRLIKLILLLYFIRINLLFHLKM